MLRSDLPPVWLFKRRLEPDDGLEVAFDRTQRWSGIADRGVAGVGASPHRGGAGDFAGDFVLILTARVAHDGWPPWSGANLISALAALGESGLRSTAYAGWSIRQQRWRTALHVGLLRKAPHAER